MTKIPALIEVENEPIGRWTGAERRGSELVLMGELEPAAVERLRARTERNRCEDRHPWGAQCRRERGHEGTHAGGNDGEPDSVWWRRRVL